MLGLPPLATLVGMRFGLRYAVAVSAFAVALVPAREARADNSEILSVFAGIGVAVAIVGDAVFTTYDIATASKNQQPERGWMVAQTSLAAPETVVAYAVIITSAEKPEFETRAPLAIPLGIAASSLATHSIWSVASDRIPPAPRLGASWLLGADLTFTALSVSETINGKLLPKSLGLVEALLMTPEAVLGAYEAVKDPDNRGSWIGIAGWSGVLATHGVISLLTGLANVQPVPKPPPRGLPPPPPEEDPEPGHSHGPQGSPDGNPAVDAPGGPQNPRPETPLEGPLPSENPPPKTSRPMVIPAPISDGYRVVPGALLVGVF